MWGPLHGLPGERTALCYPHNSYGCLLSYQVQNISKFSSLTSSLAVGFHEQRSGPGGVPIPRQGNQRVGEPQTTQRGDGGESQPTNAILKSVWEKK